MPASGLKPDCAVVVATVKALKLHGGANIKELTTENLEALKRGLPNLIRHLDNVKKFGVPVVVAINEFTSDTKAELELIHEVCASRGVKMALANHWAKGGEGAVALAELVVKTIEDEPTDFRPLYSDDLPLAEKSGSCRKRFMVRLMRIFRQPCSNNSRNWKTRDTADSPSAWPRPIQLFNRPRQERCPHRIYGAHSRNPAFPWELNFSSC